MFIFSQKRVHHLLLLLFILSLVGGSIFLDFKIFGIQFYAYRIVVLLGLAYLLFTKNLVLYTSRYSKYVFWFLSFWLFYAALSLYWCPDRAQGFKELIYIFIGFSTYLFLFSLKERIPDFEERFARFWVFVFFILVIFSINEIITKSHFKSSFTESIEKFGEAHEINAVPVFTFDNPNHYAIYLCITIIMSVYLILKKIGPRLNTFALICCLFLLYYMESRFSQLFVLFVLAMVVYHKRSVFTSWKFYRYLKWAGIGLSAFALVGVSAILVKKYSQREEAAGTTDPGTYTILVDVTEKAKLSDSTYLSEHPLNDICLGIDVEVEYRVGFKNEIVQTNYLDIKIYQPKEFFLFERFPLLKKIVFPVLIGTAFLVVCLVLLIRKKREKKTWMLLVFSGFIGLLLMGIFARHPFERVNEKWSDYVIMETQDQRKTDSVAYGLVNVENMIKRVSIQNATAQKYMNGERVTLEKLEVPLKLTNESGSDAVRKKLALNGLQYLKGSYFLGTGAGGYAILTQRGVGKQDVGTVDSPHSLIIEILAQYGVIVTLFFVLLLIYPFVFLFNQFRAKIWGINHLVLTALLVCFAIMSNSNSTSLPLPIIWINFTLIILFFNKLVSENEKENDSAN